MKHFFAILFTTVFCFLILGSKGQVNVTNPGNTTPALAGSYGSLAAAITAVNSRTAISGPVTITLTVNEIAPAGGYSITATPTGISATNKIIFDGAGYTITAATPQSTGLLTDAIFKIIGADYITIQNFVMRENPSNSNTGGGTPADPTTGNNMTEWGVALLYATTSNGAQNNTVQNNIISLNRTYQNTFGIYSNTRHNTTTIGSAVDVTSTAGANSGNKIYGNIIGNVNAGISFVGSGTAAYMDTGNDIGGTSATTGNTITNWGGATTAVSNYISNSGTYHGIFMNFQKDNNVSYNTITSAAISGTTFNLRAIHNRYNGTAPTGTFTTTISNNTITLTNGNTGGTFEAILAEQITAASVATLNITNNTILNCSSSTLAFTGINNTSIANIANINGNIFRGNTSAATGVGFTAINNTGAVYTALNINNNKLGDGSGDAITFSNATTGSLYGINCPTTGATAAISISGNNFQGFNQSIAGSGTHVYINLSHAASGATTDNINSNTFTNLTARTSAAVLFINRTGAMALNAGATQNCNNNSIVTGFLKSVAGGYVSLYNTGQTCLSGNTMNETGNNFSNITLTGATDIYGWDNEEGNTSGPTKNISNNTFQNWNCGDGAVNVIQSDFGGTGTIISGNTINNISTTSSIQGIFYGTSSKLTHTISNNTISSLSAVGTVWGISGGTSSGGSVVNITGNNVHTITSTGANSSIGIRITTAVTISIGKNKIYDINAVNAGCVAYGIDINASVSGATYNISNNMIGDIKASLTNNANAIRGISISTVTTTTTFNIYYNTVYLNAASSGTNFGTSAVYLIANATAGTGATTLRNNIFVNTSTANGTGVTAAYRRSGTNLTNYVAASNNNIFYGGIPSATNLICYDGTNSDQTIAVYKTRMATRDGNSFTELPPFLSTSGASATFLHLNTTIATLAESNAVNIATFTDDFDGDIRQGNPGSSSTGTAPDIGADEANFTLSEANPPVISFTDITTVCSYGDKILSGVTITDATGVPLTGANRPRIYYKKNAGSWFSQAGINTGGTSTNSTWNFTIVASDMGGVTGNDVISYYVIAQDLIPFTNVTSNIPSTGLVATGVNAVSTHPTSPKTYTLGYILNGTYTVGSGGIFTTLTAAVNAYNNACSLTGPVIFELTDPNYSASETFPITINNHVDASATNTLTIRPSTGNTAVITGTLTTQTINLAGAKYIRFDGRPGGTGTGKSLTITNSSTATAINFVDEAQNNIVKYCIVKGQRVSTVTGTINFSTTAAVSGTGNDNNTIDNNDISEAGGYSNIGISSAGTAGKENDNISITNNNISNFYNGTANSFGVYVNTNSSNWTITGNRLFQTATRVYTATCSQFGIYVNTGSGYTINNNVIGFANEAGTGTTNMIGNSLSLAGFPSSYSNNGTPQQIRYLGIGVANQAGSTSYIDGNTIAGFAMYTSSTASTNYGMFGGIYVESGNVNIGSIAGNIIGATSGNNSIYVATSGAGGTIVGIRAGASGNVAIQNNAIGSIIASGTGGSVPGNFTGVSLGSSANYSISNNAIGNADADNIRTGYMASGGFLSNTGTLTATVAGTTATFKGISSAGSLNTALTITNNTLRGWAMSCGGTAVTGIETSGLMLGGAVNVNNNFIGTAATNWTNTSVNNTAFFYAITISNTGATATNIKDNDIRGTVFGTQNGVGGGLIKLTGASAANNIATISGNTFTNMVFRFSSATLYFIFTNYTIASTGQLIIDNNRTVGTFGGQGTSAYYMIQSIMNSSAGSKIDITNNNFSNITAATGFASDVHGLYGSFNNNSLALTVTGNTLSNWVGGAGSMTGIDLADITGSIACSNNTISNLASWGDMEGITLATFGNAGVFNVHNNTVSGLVSTVTGGYINGITVAVPGAASNSSQTNIYNNVINGCSSPSATGIIAGIYLRSGFVSSAVSINANKIYDLLGTVAGSHVSGIYNENTLSGNITYTNNYIGDLRAPTANGTTPQITGMRLYMAGGQAKVYYNTIYLNATGSASVFSTAAVYLDPATQVTVRNNIFTNISAHGATGRTVAYWRGDTNPGTYDAASNNNLFYAGTASSQNLIFYDGTNSDQTLAAYQTRVSPKDNLSVSALPGFISTIGSNVNFLHIAATGNCAVNARGSNSGILLASDYDNDVRSTVTPFITDIGADEFSKKNAWTGANGTNWNDIGNWSSGTVPNGIEENVFISNPPANQPVIATGENYQVASIVINPGANLTNKGTLKISGIVYAPVSGINNVQAGVVTGSVEMNGNCSMPQACAGNIFSGNDVKNFTVSNDVTISSVTGEHLNISGTLAFGSTGKTLTTGDNLTLRSTQSATANIADVTGNLISGKATVERYINTGLVADGRHTKSWQFLSAPTVGQTIYQSWQESGTTPVGYGTIITGTGSGFDITTTLPSMKFFINSTALWSGVTSTASLIDDKRGYMILVRGDRSVTAYNQPATPTALRTKGNLFQPAAAPPVSTVQAGKFESIGNPYASAIDVQYMKDNGLFVNLNNNVWVWDPLLMGTNLLGGYQALSAANNYEPTAGSPASAYYQAGVSYPLIQSGNAFFVHSSGSVGSVTFTEACKDGSNRLVNRTPVLIDFQRQYFRATLFTQDGIIADGNAVVFDPVFANAIDADDADKIANPGENFGMLRNANSLSVEARSPVVRHDTIFYNISNLRHQPYQLRFAPKNLFGTGLAAYLIDKYLNSTTRLSLTDSSFVNINITDDVLSYASDRFYVVFMTAPAPGQTGTLPGHHISRAVTGKTNTVNNISTNTKEAVISVYPNPAENHIVQLHFFNQPAGTYRIELINSLGQPVYEGNIEINDANASKSIKISNGITAGVYQLNIYDSNGKKTITQVVIK